MSVYLVPVKKGRPIALDKAVVFIGRHPDCDIVLTRSRKVSRKHCCVAQVDDRYLIRDLGSMNGVRVNGVRVENEAPLRLGDEVAIGDVRYVLQVEKTRPRRKKSNGDAKSGATLPGAASQSRSGKPAEPLSLSHEFPVAIPESDESFQVESSIQDARDRDAAPLEVDGASLDPSDPSDDDIIPLAGSGDLDDIDS